MYTILILAAIGMVSADIGIGYNYKVPQTSYGVPSYQIGNSGDQKGAAGNFNYNVQSNKEFAYPTVPQAVGGQNYQSSSSFPGSNINSQYQQPNIANLASYNLNSQFQQGNAPNFLGSSQYQGGAANLGSNINSQYQHTNGANFQGSSQYQPGAITNRFNAQSNSQFAGGAANAGHHNYQYQSQYENRYQANNGIKYQQQFTQSQQPPQIFKHFYVHAAPEEPEEPKFRQPITLPAPQKHYKVIFIKTPSQPASAPQYIPVPQQTEEKTIVYVLVKKPEEPENIELPKIEPKTPEKPEVFFIKYNNKDDSQAVINNIVTDYNNGQSVKFTAINQGDADSADKYKESSGAAATAFVQTGSRIKEIPFNTAGHTLSLDSKLENASHDESQDANHNSLDSGSSASNEVGQGQIQITSLTGTGSESVANLNADNAFSTSQQVPHETYGIPNFRP